MLPQSPLVKLHFSSWNKIDHLPCVQNSQTNPNCTNPSFNCESEILIVYWFPCFFSPSITQSPQSPIISEGGWSSHVISQGWKIYSIAQENPVQLDHWPWHMHGVKYLCIMYIYIYIYVYIYIICIYIYYLYIYIYGWILIIPWPENRSSKATLGWFRLPTMIPMTSQWGRY